MATPEAATDVSRDLPLPLANKPAGGSVSAVATPSKIASDITVPASVDRKQDRGENATATVEKDVHEAFKNFAAQEKMRMLQQHQANRQQQNRQEKSVKLNDLKKFAEMFTLKTPVPQDLIPILAKDKVKQDEIRVKSEREIERLKNTPPKTAAVLAQSADPKATKPSSRPENGLTSPIGPSERSHPNRGGRLGPYTHSGRGDKQLQQHFSGMPARAGGPLGQRLAYTTAQHKAAQPMPTELRIPTGPSASSSGLQSPTLSLSARFNPKVADFRPNPSASTFTPGGPDQSNESSPQRDDAPRTQSRRMAAAPYFEGKKLVPAAERASLEDSFNVIKRLKTEAGADSNKSRQYEKNGGIPEPYRTPPTWDVPKGNEEKSYNAFFARAPTNAQPIPPNVVPAGGALPHQYQLPLHLQQNVPQLPQHHTPQQTPRHVPAQPHSASHHHHPDDHRMQFSTSNSSVHPSPRPLPPHMAYGPQGPQAVQMYQPGMPAGPYFVGVGPGGQMIQGRPMPGNPQFVNAQGQPMMPHMMANQPSSGQFMGAPMHQQQMYSPAPAHVYPNQYMAFNPQHPGPGGFPSPRPAPMMQHQGSQQGHPPQQVMYVQQAPHGAQMFAATPPGSCKLNAIF